VPDIWTPVIVAVGVIAGPLLLAYLTGRQRSRDKREDWARQDAVAAKADAVADQARKAAELLLAAQKANIERTDEVARLAAEAAAQTARKLESIDAQGRAIHTLVNQKLTDVTRQALVATTALLPLLEDAIARVRAGGAEPSATDLKRLEDTRRSIIDLEANLVQRAETQAEVDSDQHLKNSE
jgi:hypothetical protein